MRSLKTLEVLSRGTKNSQFFEKLYFITILSHFKPKFRQTSSYILIFKNTDFIGSELPSVQDHPGVKELILLLAMLLNQFLISYIFFLLDSYVTFVL